jgi:RHS repeat-associated protein
MYDVVAGHALLAHKFTGKERDTESGLDYFEARHYASALGRFMSVDPVWSRSLASLICCICKQRAQVLNVSKLMRVTGPNKFNYRHLKFE